MTRPNFGRQTLAVALLIFSLGSARADDTATVDPGRRYQTFEGWGTSLAWWVNVIGGFPEPYRSDYINKIFDLVQGLGLTVVRYNIGGGEAPSKRSLHLRESVPGFEPSPGHWDWNADFNQRWVLFAAIQKGADKFEAFSNSPPFWMTRSGSVMQARVRLNALAQSFGKRLWMSEYGDGDASGMTLSEHILSDMRLLRPTAWVYWQAVDDNDWGLLVNPQDGVPHFAYTLNPKYYVLANYSKFIRPGDTLIEIDDPHSLAAYNATSGKLVIVTTNNTAEAVNITFDVSRFRVPPASLIAYRTSPTEKLAPLPKIAVKRGKFTSAAAPHSVTTFVLTGARDPLPSPPNPFDANADYQLLNVGTGRCLAVSDTGRLVQTAPASNPGQQWRLVPADTGRYEICSRKSALVLDVSGGFLASGAKVLAYAENDGLNQQWQITPAGKAFVLINRNSTFSLTANPAGLQQ